MPTYREGDRETAYGLGARDSMSGLESVSRWIANPVTYSLGFSLRSFPRPILYFQFIFIFLLFYRMCVSCFFFFSVWLCVCMCFFSVRCSDLCFMGLYRVCLWWFVSLCVCVCVYVSVCIHGCVYMHVFVYFFSNESLQESKKILSIFRVSCQPRKLNICSLMESRLIIAFLNAKNTSRLIMQPYNSYIRS